MRRFRLRRLWRVNSKALVRAAGQNLKRLLQKRGWGRRPFPTEAVALMPAESEAVEMLPRNALLENQRASIAAASIASWEVARTCVGVQTSRFSLVNSNADFYSFYAVIIYLFLFFIFINLLSFLSCYLPI